MFRLAHISDPHLGPLPKVRPHELMNKRLLGYLSWQRKRRKIHRPEVLEALLADIAEMRPDHLALTGDITNISLPGEFEQSANWLRRLGSPQDVTLVPGNHDAYVPLLWQASWGLWQDYMAGDEEGIRRGPQGFDEFPFLRRRASLALIGLSSAQPTPLGFASGTLGDAQLARLEELLLDAGRQGLCRVVLVHHPPAGEVRWRKRLTDAEAFRQVLARAGAEIVLHGHDHTSSRVDIEGRDGPVPVFGIASASAAVAGKKPLAQYQIYAIDRSEKGWRLEVTRRGYEPGTRAFTCREVSETLLPRS